MWNYKYPDELQHHGVMGMKWGVRRWQNKDGTLTEKGKARFEKVASSERLQRRDTKAAIKVYKKNKAREGADYGIKVNTKAAEKLKAKGDTTSDRYKKYVRNAEYYTKRSEVYNKAISDLQSGKVKAGRDFVIQKDYDLYALGPYISLRTTTRIIEK